MEFLYFIWSLLPLTLFFFALKGAAKKATKTPGREFPKEFLKQAIFCAIFLALAIGIDKWLFLSIVDAIPFEEADPRIFRWLLYPAILGIAALVQHFFDKRREARERDAMRERQLRYTQKH